MVNGINSLISLDQVLHHIVGSLLCNCSTTLTFTHMLHSRYKSKEDLEAYTTHPSHLGIVRGNILLIIKDLLVVIWVANDNDLVPATGSAIHVTLLKLKEGVGNSEVVEVIRGILKSFKQISQLTYGEKFSPARAKVFRLLHLLCFP
ncbi:hypothetical protein RYX36_020747, partial [Vicia faba]